MQGIAGDVWGVVLAAGWSRRFGGKDKRLALVVGSSVISRTVDAYVSALSHVLVVTRPEDTAVREELRGLPVTHVVNECAQVGQSASLRAAVQTLPEPVAAAVIGVGDQPLLDSATIQRLVATWVEEQPPAVAPLFGGRRGNPVLFSRALFSHLLDVTGDAGGRIVLEAYPPRLVEIGSPWIGTDVDSQEDLAAIVHYVDRVSGITD